MAYFNGIQQLDQLKNEFRKLCFKYHPDHNGGNGADFIKMQREFIRLSNVLKHKSKFRTDKEFVPEKFYNAMCAFEVLKGVKVNFVGIYIWLEDVTIGATYQQRDKIKGLKVEGFDSAKWARGKKLWYFKPEGHVQKFSSNKNLEQLKNTFGCSTFETDTTQRISA